MLRFTIAAIFLTLTTIPVFATEGVLDDNGCHYDRKNGNYHCHEDRGPNPNRFAAVKKSRENVCHDKTSPNYRMLRTFAAYQNMRSCLASGGREPVQETGGLLDKPW
jgi:hypothetical protein